ncbi:hypothetical protein LEP1GSC050_1197 [Leptospira broomii serovar Hurstbridge str. 5399]|uniref:Uncharacterized protein n=1 Tax=Leptospira broomii serovar Hurstbridge str. 5399 TaxID=1049789 RepID=T0FHX5_9LEPT|nr:hypothetical protein [Leptospira broomii]EQA47192.1 hypothetical protein LEP1GSC050_1197 [Leptospira broomii serovar Hurstbridge str. 5399]
MRIIVRKSIHLPISFDLENVAKDLIQRKALSNSEVEGYTQLTLTQAYVRLDIAEMVEK